MAKLAWFLLTFLLSLCLCGAYKILVVFPFPSRSHGILGDGNVRLLLDAGHEVTYITPFLWKDPPPNLHQIDVSENIKTFPTDMINIKGLLNKETSSDLKAFFAAMFNLSEKTFNNENVVKLLNDSSQEFDVIIIEWLFSEMTAGISTIYECPYIWVSTVDPHWIVLSLIDEGLNPAYHADARSGNIPPFTFLQRLQELGSQIFVGLFRFFARVSFENNQFATIFGPFAAKKGKALPTFDEVRYNASLMLGNSHVSFGEATRLPQNYKAVGGYHIDSKVKPLPEDLNKLLENSKNGLIYFSMGSNLKSKDMPDELKRSLLDMFGELKYTVLWKFEEVLTGLPKNVHIVHWAPQTSILAHPNCILFITHGGLLSTTEAIHFGVPIIGIPVFADQFTNVDRAVKKGFAKRVDLSYSMADDLKVEINEVLSNRRYTDKAKELSMIYHDRPVSPGAELVHWVEHVVRTRGAPHLRSPALHVPFYQKLYLDLIAVIIVVLIALKFTIKRLCCSKKQVQKMKKNN